MPVGLKNDATPTHAGHGAEADRALNNARATLAHNPFSAWRRRAFSSLHWQLTIVYTLLFSILVVLFSVWITFIVNQTTLDNLLINLQIGAIVLIVVVAVILFFLTSFLLRPLRRMSDTAQAITLGDLQQRSRLTPLMEGNDEVSKLATSLNAMTEQIEQATRTERNAEQRFRRLFSDASHQLRTPLTSLRGFTEILLRGAKDDPETSQRILKLMKNEAERMTRLVNDLLMLTRLDDGTELETELIDLVDVAIEGVEHARVLATDGREVTIYFATQERLGVRANGDRLKQVIHILCDNAIKYGRPAPDGWIRLRLDQQNGHAVVQVVDNGKGVHPDDLPKIFDRFYRGEHMSIYDPSATLPPGTGLGLSIAQAIIYAHQGQITVVSSPDVETIFTVQLPCANK
ncbi:MAG: HAMP domain-containing sensor histidine kinase [Ktedonobacteraceae bacterium]